MARSRAWRVGAVVSVLVLAQVAGVLVYLRVEARRGAVPAPFTAERLRGGVLAPELELESLDGALLPRGMGRGRFVLVHFWATWCPPCREELPGLLRAGRELEGEGRLVLLAVSVDDSWPVVRDFLGGEVPSQVVRARDREGHKRYGVSTLPDTYLLSPSGELLVRFGGARDWSSDAARQYLRDATSRAKGQ